MSSEFTHQTNEQLLMRGLALALRMSNRYPRNPVVDELAEELWRRSQGLGEPSNDAAIAFAEEWYATPDTQPPGYWEEFQRIILDKENIDEH